MSHAFKRALFIHFKLTEKQEEKIKLKFLSICLRLNKMIFLIFLLPMPNIYTVTFWLPVLQCSIRVWVITIRGKCNI